MCVLKGCDQCMRWSCRKCGGEVTHRVSEACSCCGEPGACGNGNEDGVGQQHRAHESGTVRTAGACGAGLGGGWLPPGLSTGRRGFKTSLAVKTCAVQNVLPLEEHVPVAFIVALRAGHFELERLKPAERRVGLDWNGRAPAARRLAAPCSFIFHRSGEHCSEQSALQLIIRPSRIASPATAGP